MNVLGDPLFNLLGPVAGDTENPESLERIAAAKAEYHLDDPLPVRYVKWLGAFVTGDFGVQFSTDGEPPVADLIKERAPRTIMLLVMARRRWRSSSRSRGRCGRRRRPTSPSIAAVDVGGLHADRRAELRAGRDPQVHLLDQVGLVPAALRRHRHPGRPGAFDDPAGADARLADRRRLPTAAPHRPDHDPPGGLHPDGAQQGRVATSRALQARLAALVVLVHHRVRDHDRQPDRRSARRRADLPDTRSRVGGAARPWPGRTSRSCWRS